MTWNHKVKLIVLLLAFVPFNASGQTPQQPPIQLVSVEELKTLLTQSKAVTIIDVRSAEGYAQSDKKIKGALHVKLRRLGHRLTMPPLSKIPRDQEVITYCACPAEHSSIEAAQKLLSSGFKNVRALKGGWVEWVKLGGPVEVKSRSR